MTAGDRHGWWTEAIVYQVYVRSFADADGDGTGDIDGLRSRLDYLHDLGVDAIWLNPWYRSPLRDGGYDVADYRAIEPRYGTLESAEAFIAEAHERNIKVIVDLVPNHTSAAHPWFVEARAAGPGSDARARYVFRDGRGPDGSEPPTDWPSVFGGPAWTRIVEADGAPGQWYLHLFDGSQPDLDWTHPEVRAEFEDIIEFWLRRGVDGFRVDVAHGMAKDQAFPDLDGRPSRADDPLVLDHPYFDRDELHPIVRSWRQVLDRFEDRMMVAEASVHPTRLPLYIRPDEYDQSFNFELLDAAWDVEDFRTIILRSLDEAASVGSLPTWVLSNHDVMRHTTRYGLPAGTDWKRWPLEGPADALDGELGLRRARAALLVVLALPGSAYLFQGEELGLPEVWDLDTGVLDDPVWVRSGNTEKGRDGCRVPLPWSTEGPSLGFGAGDPWLPQPERFADFAAEAQTGDPTSTLELYRAAIAGRSEFLVGAGDVAVLTPAETVARGVVVDDHADDLLVLERGELTVVLNMGAEEARLGSAEVVLSSRPLRTAPDGHTVLPGNAGVWLRNGNHDE